MITIVPYNPQWPLDFTRLAAPLRHALGDLAVRVDHIGSTAVPGLAAKDVIDMQVTVREQLARYHPLDPDAYYDIKDPVCDLIWSAAEEWAHGTNWQPAA